MFKVEANMISRLISMAIIAIACLVQTNSARSENTPTASTEVLAQSSKSWDGKSYRAYPIGIPELAVMKIYIPPKTKLPWHFHPAPSAAYLLSGKLTVEKQNRETITIYPGQALLETVKTWHRGVTYDKPAVLIAFYAGSFGMPLSEGYVNAHLESGK
ncbi:cupin [Chromobacterium sp. ATCC 53434]|nr:cupin [Chromobacterium sp. ATCC 53434]